jgi:hypothetical protein
MARAKADGAADGAADGGVNKMDLVRQAIEALPDGTPKQLQAHIKQQSGKELTTLMISSYKSQIKRKGLDAPDATVGVRDLTTLQDLIKRVGAPQLQALIKVLAK